MIKFTATKLTSSGKKGTNPPDEEGYYTLLVGGLNVANASGTYYVYEGSKNLFEASSSLMRRMSNGILKGEMAHPDKLPGMSEDDYIDRLLTILESNVCCHIKELWLDVDFGRQHPEVKNPTMVAIFAKVRPCGPKGQYLKDALDNPSENVCFSIRSFAEDVRVNHRKERTIIEVVTFDWVIEGGIVTASQWDTIAMESIDTPTSIRQLERVVSRVKPCANEDADTIAHRCLDKVKPISTAVTTPRTCTW